MDKTTLYMRRAIELAEQARGKCSPNPFVGAVIVKDGKIVGEGFTQKYGFDHAEVQAIKQAGKQCRNAEIYVTLEPCAHYGKTPPCAKAIIESGIKKVYYGIDDPNPLVAGKGRQMLTESGIIVEYGFCAEEITHQLEYYLTYITKQRPFVFLKTAITLDGRIAAMDGTSRWISCEASRNRTHELRQEADAVLTGIGTVLKDNPLLNVRLDNPYKQPVRVILDAKLSIPLIAKIVQTASEHKTLIFTSSTTKNIRKEKALTELGLEICRLKSCKGYLDLNLVMQELYNRKIGVVMIEAGARVNSSFLKAGLVDKIYAFLAPKLLGGAYTALHDIGIESIDKAIDLQNMQIEQIDKDILITAYPNQ